MTPGSIGCSPARLSWSTSARVGTRSQTGRGGADCWSISAVAPAAAGRESPFHNPFRLQDHGRDEAIRLYRATLERRPDLLVQLPRLRGRALSCWCWPQPCHGDVLCALLAA
jgi:hypothetical protein